MSSVVMSGALREFDVTSILQAVSLSRQCTLLRLWDRNKRETGEIRLKAGQLLDATCGSKRGRAALHSLLRGDHHTFRVERFADPVNLPRPVGPLATLLLEMPHPVTEAPPVPPPTPRRAATPKPVRIAPAEAKHPIPSATAVPLELAQALTGITALEGMLICQLPNCLHCWAWVRGTPRIPTEALCGYIGGLVQARAAGAAASVPTAIMVMLAESTLIVRPFGAHAVSVCCFAPETPLGLVRLVGSEADRLASTMLASAQATAGVGTG